MSRVCVFPNGRWALKMSIGKKIARLSKKDHRTRELSIQPPISKNQSTQKWKEGLVNFIVESKRQLSLDARDTIKKVEQWQRQSCAMFDMVQQQILQNHDDRHESMDIAVNSNAHEKTFTKATVSGSSAKKSSTAAKKTPAIAKKPSVRTKKLKKIAKKTSVSAKAAPAAASKAFGKKPSTAAGTANKASTSSSKQKKANSSKGTAHGLTNQILPDLSSDSSSDESTENSPVSQKSSCPSMPVLQTEEIESDDNLKEFMKKPIAGLTAEAVRKRRQSDFARTQPSIEFPMRKKPMMAHSSVLAIHMNKSPLNTVASKPQSDPEIGKETSSTPVPNVDKTNGVRKIVEKEPEPIPNFLKSPEKDDFYVNFEKLRQRMNEAKKLADKVSANASNGAPNDSNGVNVSNGEASGQASSMQEPSIDE